MLLDPYIKVKPGVVLFGVHPIMITSAITVAGIYKKYMYECWITGGREGSHSARSLHYKGFALDWRKWTVPIKHRRSFVEEVQIALNRGLLNAAQNADTPLYINKEFQMIIEKTHFHLELDDKK